MKKKKGRRGGIIFIPFFLSPFIGCVCVALVSALFIIFLFFFIRPLLCPFLRARSLAGT